jgi:hypothetical protein
MAIYTELFFNGTHEQLAGNFPILRQITDDEHWYRLVRDFLIRHRSSTPLFTEIGQEFLQYLKEEHETWPEDPPFLLELAHYEYVELAVAISDADQGLAGIDPSGDLMEGRSVINPSTWTLTYDWPVHRIGPDYLPEIRPEHPTHLVVYRDQSDAVHFLEINVVTQRLLQLLREDAQRSGRNALQLIASELGHPNPDAVIEAGKALLDDLRERNVILGTWTR